MVDTPAGVAVRTVAAFSRDGLDAAAVPLWFARLLRDGFALAAIGQYRPFAEVAAETLRGLAADRIDDDARTSWCSWS
jgi:hypothetical protein